MAAVGDALASVTWGCTGVVVVDEHRAGSSGPPGQFVSGWCTAAVLATEPAAPTSVAGKGSAASTTRSMVSDPLAGTSTTHVTVAPVAEQPGWSAEAKDSPAGRTSVTTAPVTATGVSLVTVSR